MAKHTVDISSIRRNVVSVTVVSYATALSNEISKRIVYFHDLARERIYWTVFLGDTAWTCDTLEEAVEVYNEE